jgi:hypothetical protein
MYFTHEGGILLTNNAVTIPVKHKLISWVASFDRGNAMASGFSTGNLAVVVRVIPL